MRRPVPRFRRLRWISLTLPLFVWGPAPPVQAQSAPTGPAPAAAVPPVPKSLSEADEGRLDELIKTIDALGDDGKFAEAVEPARQALALCEKALGPEHWRTADQRRRLETLQTIAGLPDEGRKAVVESRVLATAGTAAYTNAQYEKAAELLSRSLEIDRRWMGERHPDTAGSYNDLGAVLRARGDLAGAEAMMRKALAIQIESPGERHPDTASSYSNLAVVLLERGDLAGAEAMQRKALAIEIEVLGERHIDIAFSYNNLAVVLLDRGDLAGAEAMHREALAIRIGSLGERHLDTAASYNNLARTLRARGDLTEAEAMASKALAVRIESLGERHPDTADSYGNLATILLDRGDLAGAEAMQRKALAVRVESLGERHPATAASYNNLAVVLLARGDLTGAEAMHRKALAIRIEVLGERHFSTATSYNDLAMVLHFRGDPPDAEAMQRKALAIEVEVLGERHPFTATSYSNLALMLRDRGDPLGAEAMQRKALAIEVEVLGERHPATSRSYNNLALELKERGDLAGAEAMQRKALAIEVEVLGERHPDTAAMYGNLAQVLRDRGDLAGAEAMQRKALAIRIEVLGERHPRTAASYDNLGTVLDDLGRTGEAIDALENAVHAASGARGGNARGLEDAARDLVQPHPLLAVLLARTGRPVDAWDRWESGLSRALLDEVAGRAARPLTPDEREREAALLGQAQAGDERIGRLLAGGEPTPEIERRLEDVRRESSEARRQLLELQARFEKSYGPLAGRPATLDAVRAALDDHTALVGWVDAGRRHWACVARRTGDPVWVDIPGGGEDGAWTKDEQALADRLRAALASTSLKDDWRPMAEAMAKQRLAPLGPHLEEARRVVVVNSPGLAGVPVELLFEARAGAGGAAPVVSYAPSASMFAYLVGRKSSPSRPDALLAVGDPAYPEPGPAAASPPPPAHGLLVAQVVPNGNADLHGVRSGDVLLAYDGATLKAQADLRVAPADGPPRQVPMTLWRDGQEQAVALAIGPLGVALDPRPAAEVVLASRAADEVRRGSRAGAWPRLPETRLEVEAIAGMFPDGGATTLLGDQARESVVQDLARTGRLRTFRYLHFATHGRDDPASAYRTALILAPDPDQGDDPAASDPLDGEITAEQIARTWNLDADLVVLSACETALGKRAGGEGLLGFTQPLLAKGARSLVLSLWQVNDRSTALLMTRFYRNMLGKRAGLTAPMPKAEALAEAKRWLREATSEEVGEAIRSLPRGEIVHRDDLAPPPSARPYEDPRHWAPFILVGAPD